MTKKKLNKSMMKFFALASAAIALAAACPGTVRAAPLELISPPPPFLPRAAAAPDGAETRFEPGMFRRGDKALRWSATQPLSLMIGGEVAATFFCRAATGHPGYLPEFRKFDNAIDPDSNSVRGVSDFPLNDAGDKGVFSQEARLEADGRVAINFAYGLGGGAVSNLEGFVCAIEIPRTVAAGRRLRIGARVVALPDEADWNEGEREEDGRRRLWVNMGADRTTDGVEFNPGNPVGGFKVALPRPVLAVVFRSHNFVQVRFVDDFDRADWRLSMVVDLGDAAAITDHQDSVVAGINFTRSDNLNVPVYRGSPNLFMNPAFNSGTRYFTESAFKRRFRDNSDSLIDCAEAFGGKAFRLAPDAVRGIHSFGIPIYADKPYTVSFYAKPEAGEQKRIDLGINSYMRLPAIRKDFNLVPGEWTRCEHTFSIPRSQVMFNWTGDGVLLSGLQLEEGETATAYSGNPFGLELLTDSPDGMVCAADRPISARLAVRGPVAARGRARVSASDFFYREFYTGEFTFDLDEAGEAVIPLPLDDAMPIGPTVVRVDVVPDTGRPYTDFLRLVRVKHVGNDFKNTHLHSFAKYAYNTDLASVPEEELSLFGKLGFGQHTYHVPIVRPQSEDFARLVRHGLGITSINATSLLAAHVANEGRQDGRWSRYDGELLDGQFSLDYRLIDGAGPEFLDAIEEASRKMARKYSFIDHWMGHSEPEGAKLIRERRFEEFARIQVAINRGIKRGNPAARFIYGGACNMGKAGRDVTLGIIEACRKVAPEVEFDGAEIHTYRDFPEQPDTDEELQQFFAGLKEQGYDESFKVALNEGAYFYPLNVPQWLGIAPWSSTTASKDRYQTMHTPSYDMGWAERLGAAMTLRYWLVCYKHMDRVDAATPWGVYLLDNRTPYAWVTMSSALADILGNSSFKRDIRFAPGARAYVFEDEQQRPVAAVWQFSENVERGRERPPRMRVDFAGLEPELLDLYGNPRLARKDADGRHDLPLSNFPFYLRGEVGGLEAFCAAIQGAQSSGIRTLPLKLSARPVSRDAVQISVLNPLTRDFEGVISVNAEPDRKLELASQSEVSVLFTKDNCIPDNRIADVSIPVSISESGQQRIDEDFRLRAFAANHLDPGAIDVDAAIDDWEGIPQIPLEFANAYREHRNRPIERRQAGGFSASYRVAWNEETLFMLLEITDDAFGVDRGSPDPGHWYARNSVQLFLDTLGDGPAKARNIIRDYDENDYSYELLPWEDGESAVVYRRVAPDTQLTGGVHHGLMPGVIEPGVKVAFRRDGRKQVYEVAFPLYYVQPMELSEGAVSGLGIMVFDHAGARTLLNIPHGLDVSRSPQNYPAMLLVGRPDEARTQ